MTLPLASLQLPRIKKILYLFRILAFALVREKKGNKEMAEEEKLIREAFHKGQRGSVIGH